MFALYVTGYSAFRIFEESLRVDYSQHFLGLRLNFFVATAMTLAGLAWFAHTRRRGRATASCGESAPPAQESAPPEQLVVTATEHDGDRHR